MGVNQGCRVTKEVGPIDSEAVFYCEKIVGHIGEHVAIGVDWELTWTNDEEDADGE